MENRSAINKINGFSSSRVPAIMDPFMEQEKNFVCSLEEDEFPSTQVANEAGVIVEWAWDLSQHQKSEIKFNSILPVARKRRQCKPKETEPSCNTSPVRTRRKRLLRKENQEWNSQLMALSEKLKRSKEVAKKEHAAAENTPSTSRNMTESSSTASCEIDPNAVVETKNQTEDNRELEHAVDSVINKNVTVLRECTSPVKLVTPPKNNSFSDFFEDLDDDSLIRCTQQVEQCMKQSYNKSNHEYDCKESFERLTSPGRTRLSVKVSSPRSPKVSLGKITTPAKVVSSKYPTVVNSVLRRSPRLCGKPKELKVAESMPSRSNILTKAGSTSSGIAQSTQKNNSAFDDILDSFLEEDIDLLSQIPEVSVMSRSPRNARNTKGLRAAASHESETRRSQHRSSFENSFKKSEVNAKVPLAFSKDNASCIAVTRRVDSNVSFAATKCSVSSHTPLVENSVHSLDDSFMSSDILDVLDKTESKLKSGGLSYAPQTDAKRKSLDKEERSNSPPLRCTPDEIEVKRQQALLRLQSRQDQSFASLNVQFRHGPISKSVPISSNPKPKQANIGGSQRYTAEEIERKRLEALQKRLQRQKEKAMLTVNRTKYQPLSAKHTKWC